MKNHVINHHKHTHELENDSTMHVIGVITNPARWQSRYRIFKEWYQEMRATKNVQVYIVEAAIGDRKHELVDHSDPCHLALRTRSEIWIKENLINLGVRYLLPCDWNYLSWVDCDVFFKNHDWAIETIHNLQSLPIVQPWQDCADLGPHGNISKHFKSFGFQDQKLDQEGNKVRKQMHPSQAYEYAHSGFAWSCTREFFEHTRGLLDCAILGSADHHMAFACTGHGQHTVHSKMSKGFKQAIADWQHRAMHLTHGQVGFTHGRIEHAFHGPKGRRYYRERWQILIEHGFDPYHDLYYDKHGLLHLKNKPALEHAIRRYNKARAEDSIEEF